MSRMNPKERREQIMIAAIKVAEKKGYDRIERKDVANAANCAEGLINNYYGTMNQLKRDVMRRAVKDGNLIIIAQGLAVKDKHALKADTELKSKAIVAMMG